jgi:hypothetical protein
VQPTNPTLFIGSSSESLAVAYAVQKNLEHVADVMVWTQGVFKLSKYNLESLLDAVEDSDFGLFVFGPDDMVTMRGAEMSAVRDNVIFELGLFIGRLGRERTFMLMPSDSPDLHLPTDLLGIQPATYRTPPRPERLLAALGPACHDIGNEIRAAKQAPAANGQTAETAMILAALIPEAERRHLFNLADGATQSYSGGKHLRSELRHLRAVGLVRKQDGRNIAELRSGSTHDLKDILALTDLGREWAAKLRAEQIG